MKYILSGRDTEYKPRCPFYRQGEKQPECFVRPLDVLGFRQPCVGVGIDDCPLAKEDVIVTFKVEGKR